MKGVYLHSSSVTQITFVFAYSLHSFSLTYDVLNYTLVLLLLPTQNIAYAYASLLISMFNSQSNFLYTEFKRRW